MVKFSKLENWLNKRQEKLFLKIFALFFFSALLVSCDNAASENNPYAAEIELAYQNAESDYVREILRDGKITDTEVDDAQKRHIACLAENGITAWYYDDGGGYGTLTMSGDMTEAESSAENSCWRKWMGQIHSIYVDQTRNPNNYDFDTLVVECLVNKDLVDEDFTAADYRELGSQNARNITIEEDTPQIFIFNESPYVETFLPSGVPRSDPRVILCETNPSR